MAEPPKGRVLVIAHAFVPASPIGTMRTLRLVRRLVAEGWGATVLTASPHTYLPDTPMDAALFARVPPEVKVVYAPVLRGIEQLQHVFRAGKNAGSGTGAARVGTARSRPTALRRAYALVDELTAIPDKEVGWVVPAVAKGLVTVARERPNVLYSSSPPWTGQVVGLMLATLTRLPWVADFRDPWARAPWREKQPERVRRAAVSLERRVVHRADAVLFATRTNRDEYAAHYGERLARRFHVVPNGCDPAEFVSVKQHSPSDRFVMLHAGSLYGARTPVPLFRAIAAAIQNGTLDRDRFRLRLIGATSAKTDFPAAAAALGLDSVVEFLPRMRRHEIVREMASASCLLVLQPGTTVSIPGKLYEYFAIGRPILALTEEGELSELVRQSGIGIWVSPHDEAGLEAALEKLVEIDRTGPLQPPPTSLYDGNLAAHEAVRVIESVLQARHPRRVTVTEPKVSNR